MLFYTQCCDVNQPLHPLGRAIPTLGEASGSSPGHWNLFPSFPGSQLEQSRAQGAALVGVSCGSTQPCPASTYNKSHEHPVSTSGSALQDSAHSSSKSASAKFSLWNISSPWNIAPEVSAPRSSCCHPFWTPLCRTPTAVTKLLLVPKCPGWKDSYLEWIHTFHFSEFSGFVR